MSSEQTNRVGLLVGMVVLVGGYTSVATAEPWAQALHLRTSGAGALMLSKDQRSWLMYDRPGLLGDIQLAYAAEPWLDVQFGATGGVFLSHAPGGLAAPVVGMLARLPTRGVVPYALLDLGVGFTGAILRPFARTGVGLEFTLTRHFRAGPNIGLGVVTQWDRPGYSNDAVFAWFGLSCSYWPTQLPAAARDPLLKLREPPPPAAVDPDPVVEVAPEPVRPAAPPSAQLTELLELALPTQRSELLAPVLFALDSADLDPSGIAMLHEVARVLCTTRSDIDLLEIVAYADARGSAEHNLELSRRRGASVRAWLIDHGVAADRLQVEAQGSAELVEDGDQESAHQQNRRVVFRVLHTRQP